MGNISTQLVLSQHSNKMSYLVKITSPTLLLNKKICDSNLRQMKAKADKLGLRLIPHFKTPQSKIIGQWAKNHGIEEISVSSVKMAHYMRGMKWKSIHIAFPFNTREIEALNKLSSTDYISVQLVNLETTTFLTKHVAYNVSFFIEIDAGYGRTGVKNDDFNLIDAILAIADKNSKLNFKGFYIHPGHSYYTSVQGVYKETLAAVKLLKELYKIRYPDLVIRCGDTPGSSMNQEFGSIDELGPGNFIFYDLTQAQIGSCSREDIAVALAVPVVDINYLTRKILVHGGGVHLSKDFIHKPDGTKHYGEVVNLTESGWVIPANPSYVEKISQEHGTIQASDELINQVSVGDLIGILPIHSCMTADCMRGYLSTEGEWIDHAEGLSKHS